MSFAYLSYFLCRFVLIFTGPGRRYRSCMLCVCNFYYLSIEMTLYLSCCRNFYGNYLARGRAVVNHQSLYSSPTVHSFFDSIRFDSKPMIRFTINNPTND
jgi:hypothetical protein